MHEQTSTPETPGKGLQGPREKSRLLLPAAPHRKRAGRPSLCQHGSSGPSAAQLPCVPQHSGPGTNAGEKAAPCLPAPGEGLSHGVLARLLWLCWSRALAQHKEGWGRRCRARGSPHLDLQENSATDTLEVG